MSTVPAVDTRPALVRLYECWNGVLSYHAVPGVYPLLRLERGAGLVRDTRTERVGALMDPLLALAAPRLYLPPTALAGAVVRPKIRIFLGLGGAGLTVQLRYYGAAPADAQLQAALAHLGPGVCPLPPRTGEGAGASGDVAGLGPGETCLRVAWAEPPRRLPLVQVMAGRRQVAVPLFAVARALPEDGLERPLPGTRSLATCLGEDPTPAAHGRPAVLVLRRRGEPVALRVEALLGHGPGRVLPAGPLLQALPWLLGVHTDGDVPPVLVLDPLALPGVLAGAGT